MSCNGMGETLSPQSSVLSPSPRLLRLFIALETSDAVRQAIDAAQRALRQRGDLPVRWTNPAQAHLTLQFLGDVVAEQVPALIEAVKPAVTGHRALLLRTGDVGAFPSAGAPRVLWLGVRGREAGLLLLQRAVVDAVRGVTGLVADPKPFHPHLTLGRLKNGYREEARLRAVAAALARPVPVPTAIWPVGEVSLIHSVLGAGGPRYTTLERFPLAEGQTAA